MEAIARVFLQLPEAEEVEEQTIVLPHGLSDRRRWKPPQQQKPQQKTRLPQKTAVLSASFRSVITWICLTMVFHLPPFIGPFEA
jgi:hypothetical protein